MQFQADRIKTIIFDYDGTIHESLKIYAPAFRKAYEYLVSVGVAEDRVWSDDEISHWLGFTSIEMWKNFMPNLDQEVQAKASSMIGEEMRRLIAEGQAVLYENALSTLSYLKDKGYTLVFLSNCSISYMNKANELFGLNQYFDEMHNSEAHDFMAKEDILKKIMVYYPKEMVIVGDRFHDMVAGKVNKIRTIGCSYGYGKEDELKQADLIIDSITDLIEIF